MPYSRLKLPLEPALLVSFGTALDRDEHLAQLVLEAPALSVRPNAPIPVVPLWELKSETPRRRHVVCRHQRPRIELLSGELGRCRHVRRPGHLLDQGDLVLMALDDDARSATAPDAYVETEMLSGSEQGVADTEGSAELRPGDADTKAVLEAEAVEHSPGRSERLHLGPCRRDQRVGSGEPGRHFDALRRCRNRGPVHRHELDDQIAASAPRVAETGAGR
jgi:hypothetical protein